MESDTVNLIPLIYVAILIMVNAFFVAGEFSIISVRESRINEILKQNDSKLWRYVKKSKENMDSILAGVQLGITVTSLLIGWLAEESIAHALVWLMSSVGIDTSTSQIHTVSIVLAIVIATFLHVTLGEQVPKMVGIRRAEFVSVWTAIPLYYFCKIITIVIKVLEGTTSFILKYAFRIDPKIQKEYHSEEEIRYLMSKSQDIDDDEEKMVRRIFDFDERIIREIMVPRVNMECLYLSDPIGENIKIVKASKHSRFPLCGEDKDDILGYINVKDLYIADKVEELGSFKHEIVRFIETKTIKAALKEMQENQQQIAIVTDEFGGVAGLITMEDIMEEIVGDIRDEYDIDEKDSFVQNGDRLIAEGHVLVDEIAEELETDIKEVDGIDTIGGYIVSYVVNEMNEKLEKGMTVTIHNLEFQILEYDGVRIQSLSVKKIENKEESQE